MEMPQDPSMPPAAAAPPQQQVSPEQVAAAEGQADQEAMAAMAATAPIPDEPYKVSTIQMIIKELNGLVEKVTEAKLDDANKLAWSPPDGGGSTWNQPLPAPVYVPMVMLGQAAASDPKFAKHVIDLPGLKTDGALTKAAGMLRRMGSDKAFVQALRPPAAAPEMEMGAPEEGPPPPMPE
jgi:hypothetical protein